MPGRVTASAPGSIMVTGEHAVVHGYPARVAAVDQRITVTGEALKARELRVRAGLLAVRCQWGAFGHPEGMFSARELAYGIHGGDVETSLMLKFKPELVDMAQAETFTSSAEGMGNFKHLRPTGAAAYGWIASDLNAAGTVGDAAAATAEKGAAVCDHQVDGFVELLRDVEAFDLSRLG